MKLKNKIDLLCLFFVAKFLDFEQDKAKRET